LSRRATIPLSMDEVAPGTLCPAARPTPWIPAVHSRQGPDRSAGRHDTGDRAPATRPAPAAQGPEAAHALRAGPGQNQAANGPEATRRGRGRQANLATPPTATSRSRGS
jgi:hypothetical protein